MAQSTICLSATSTLTDMPRNVNRHPLGVEKGFARQLERDPTRVSANCSQYGRHGGFRDTPTCAAQAVIVYDQIVFL